MQGTHDIAKQLGPIARRLLTPCDAGMNRDAARKGIPQRETRAADVQHHAVPGVDHVDFGAFTNTQGAEATGLVGRAADVDHRGLTS